MLGEISSRVLSELRQRGAESVLDPDTREQDYHGFERVAVRPEFLRPWKNRTPREVSVEVITVHNCVAAVHYHNHVRAILTILGHRDGFLEPEGCHYIYRRSDMKHAAFSGITLEVAPRMLHGFGSPEGCNALSFLSVQSEKVTDDDFHVVNK